MQKNDAISVYNIPQHEQKKRKIEKKETEKEEANGHEENLNKVELQNPASDTWLMKNRKSPWAGKKEGLQTELTDEQKKYAEEYAKRKGEERERGGEKKGEILPDKSTFHGKEERLSRKVLDCTSQGCQGQQRSLLYTEEIGAHLEWPHEGRVCNKVLPETGAFDIVSRDGYKGENLGCVQFGQMYEDLHGSLQGS